MNNEEYYIGDKLYVVGSVWAPDVDPSYPEFYIPAPKYETVESVRIETRDTYAKDGSQSQRIERWHVLSDGRLVGPKNLVKWNFGTLESVMPQVIKEIDEDIADFEKDLEEAQAKIKILKAKRKEYIKQGYTPG